MKTIPYARQSLNSDDIRESTRALRSDWITQGPRVRQFEDALSGYTGAKYAIALSSGTAALHVSMVALGIGRGDKVLTSPITFSASANCALYVGAKPVFVDIDDKTYHIDIDKLKKFLSLSSNRKNLKAVIPVHFMGTVSDTIEIKRICDKYGIKIVEDAAHAPGALYSKRTKVKVGSSRYSDTTIFSFHPIKHITTGEGGAILTNNRRIHKTALQLRHHGIIKSKNDPWSYDIPIIGFNYRITDFQCALGTSQLTKIDDMVKTRRKLVDIYNDRLSGIREIRLPYEREGTYASYHLYVIRVADGRRDKLCRYLKKNNILTQVNYLPVHLFSFYRKKFGYRAGDFPVSENYAKECLSLPLYVSLSKTDQSRVIMKIKEFFK